VPLFYTLYYMFEFGEGKPDWFEIEQVCMQCGQLFIADYKYNNLCVRCRYPEWFKTKEDENKEDEAVDG
jgi:ribosomal protein S27AE